jgi:hypothetical protein
MADSAKWQDLPLWPREARHRAGGRRRAPRATRERASARMGRTRTRHSARHSRHDSVCDQAGGRPTFRTPYAHPIRTCVRQTKGGWPIGQPPLWLHLLPEREPQEVGPPTNADLAVTAVIGRHLRSRAPACRPTLLLSQRLDHLVSGQPVQVWLIQGMDHTAVAGQGNRAGFSLPKEDMTPLTRGVIWEGIAHDGLAGRAGHSILLVVRETHPLSVPCPGPGQTRHTCAPPARIPHRSMGGPSARR